MNLLQKALVFALIGLATCNPLNNNFGEQDALAKQDTELEKAYGQVRASIKSVQAKCKELGKESVGEGLENKLKEGFSCIQKKINLDELRLEFVTYMRVGQINEIFNKFCSLWPHVHTCLNPLITDSKQCLDKESQHGLDLTMGLYDDSNNFFCENNHTRMTEFFEQGGMQCLQSVIVDIRTCLEPTLKRREGKTQDKLSYDQEDCTDAKEMRTCVSSQTRRCNSQVPTKILDDFLAIIQKVTCNSA